MKKTHIILAALAAVALLAPGVLSFGATPITDATLRGATTQPSGATFTASGSVTFAPGSALVVSSGASVSGLVRTLADAALTGDVTLSPGSLTLGQGVPLVVGGAATFNAGASTTTLGVSGAATLSGTLNVGGAATLASLTVAGATTLTGTSAHGGAATFNAATFAGLSTFNGGASLNSTTTLQSGRTFTRNGATTTNGTDNFTSGAALTFNSGSLFALAAGSSAVADNAANLRGLARAARYAVFEIPLGVNNRTAATNYAEFAGGSLAPISGYSYGYGFSRTDGTTAYFAADGSFVAPVAGYYFFSVGASAAGNQSVWLLRNAYPTASTPSGQTGALLASNAGNGQAGASLTWAGKLDAGDRITIGGTNATSAPNYANTQFFIARLQSDPGTEWTDFELKGSVNNFEGVAENALVYFYGSAYGAGTSTHGAIGVTKAVFFTDDTAKADHGAARKWRVQDATRSLWQQKVVDGSIIGGVVVVVPVTDIIHPHNSNLIFSYQRVSADGLEETWVPIVPKWLIVDPRPTGLSIPADNQPPPPTAWILE
jgi:hypothetical protein